MNTSKEVILDAANSMVQQLRIELESITRNRCETCGAKIYCGPPDCPVCGAPNCCPQCCKIDSLTKERDELKIKLLEVAHLKHERDRYRTALMAILNYPVHSEPVGGAYAMSDIADAALKGGPK